MQQQLGKNWLQPFEGVAVARQKVAAAKQDVTAAEKAAAEAVREADLAQEEAAAAMLEAAAAREAAAPREETEAAAEQAAAAAAVPEAAVLRQHKLGAAVTAAVKDLRYLAAEVPCSLTLTALREVQRCHACLGGIPTQSNQPVARTREGVHAAFKTRLEHGCWHSSCSIKSDSYLQTLGIQVSQLSQQTCQDTQVQACSGCQQMGRSGLG